jgi:exonuclease VII small subunit
VERLGAASARVDGLLARLQAGGDPAVASAHLDATAGELRQLRSGLGTLVAGMENGQQQLERAGAAASRALAAVEAAEGVLDAAAARAEAAAAAACAAEAEEKEASSEPAPGSTWGLEAVRALREAEARLLASGDWGGGEAGFGPWLAGDAPTVSASAAVRSSVAALREATAALMGASEGAGGLTGGHCAAHLGDLRAAASSLADCAKALRKLKAATSAAALCNAACLETAAAGRELIGEAIALLERLDGPPAAGQESGGWVGLLAAAPEGAEAEADTEAARLQLEAAALRELLAARDSRIRELEKRQRQLLSGAG